ncbi:phosphatase PAP2 family protein [Plantactinospora sp. WMMC1484]|uniref:phosphatase PAP2 family protein n=1 Tax=Plantactinospora sp. WMMC1484 TaxID=3404122 RepID=UPI003BF5DCAE
MHLVSPLRPVSPHPPATPPQPPPPSPGRPVGRLLRAGLGGLLGFVLTAVGFVGTAAGQSLDGRLLPRAERGGGYEQPTDLVGPAKAVLACFGDLRLLGLLVGAILLLGVLNRRPWAGLAGVLLVGAAVVAASAAKQAIIRPDLAVPTSTTHNSFPSGHVTAAMALLLATLLVLPAPARWWVALPGAVGVCAVGAATMIAGWHRFSDVVGGVLLAATLFCPVAAALARPRPGAGGGTGPGGVALGLVGLVGLLGGVPLLALLGGGPSLHPGAVPVGLGGPFAAIAAGSGLVLLLVAGILAVLRPVDFAGPTPHGGQVPMS